MKILFVTGLYPKEEENTLKILSKIGLQNAPNVFQWAIIDGLSQNDVDFEVVSCPFLPAFPISFKKCFIPSSDIIFEGKNIGKMLSYCDFIGYKTYSIKKKLYKYVCEWAEHNIQSGEQLVLLSYTPYPPFMPFLKKLKYKYGLTVATIVTDLVDDMLNFKSNRTIFKYLQTLLEIRQTKALYSHIDKFILLSKKMTEKIPEAIGRQIVIEGITTPKYNIKPKETSALKTFLYTGTLEAYGGIDNLVKAFTQIDNPNIKLIICGAGPLKQMILEAAQLDKRIDFRGLVSHEEAVALQQDATVLVNPRKPDGGITKYSFPSKTMEYLSSGTPMIGYKLEGIPAEYYSFYYTVDGLDELTLMRVMLDVASKSQNELNQKAKKAFDFIQKNKTSKIQVHRIIEFLAK